MIVKKVSVSKTTGEKTVHFTTDKEGFKVVIKDGSPVEVKMNQDEISNRDHGANTDGKGAIGSSNGQKGITRTNKEFETEYKMSKIDEMSNNFNSQLKKVEELTCKLKKAKLDLNSAILDKKMDEFNKKEAYYKKALEYVNKDKKKLKTDNMFFIKTDTTNTPNKDNITDKLSKIELSIPVATKVEESITFESKMKKIIELDKMIYGDKKRSYVKGDVLDRINKKLKEADVKPPEEDKKPSPDEEEPTPDAAPTDEPTPDAAPTDEPTPDGPLGDEPTPDGEVDPTEDGADEERDAADDVPVEPNEIERVTTVNQYNIDSNNVYDYYDFIIDKLVDPTSIEALNAEYSSISPDKRKITSASQLYNRVSKRVAKMNKTETDKLNNELSGSEDGADDGLGGDLNI